MKSTGDAALFIFHYCSKIAMHLDCRDLILSDFHLRVQGCQK